MRRAELAIFYEPERGRPLTIARVGDRRLLLAVAEAAIAEADERARALDEADGFLGALQREEAERMRHVLGILLPELLEPERRLEVVARNEREADRGPGT